MSGLQRCESVKVKVQSHVYRGGDRGETDLDLEKIVLGAEKIVLDAE